MLIHLAEEFFQNGGAKIYFLKNTWTSKKETIVFLHGFPDGPEIWGNVASLMSDKYNIVIPYLPGVHPNCDLEKMMGKSFLLNLLLLIRSEKKINRMIHLVGHDIGGVLVDQLSYLLGDSCKSITFISTMGLNLYSKNLKINQIIKSWYVPIFALKFGQKVLLKNFSVGKKILKKLDSSVIESKIPKKLGSIKLYREYVELLVAPTRWDRINQKKSLFIFSKKDPFVQIPEKKILRQYYSDSTIRVIDGGHWEFVHQYEKYAEILNKQLVGEDF